MDLLCDLSGGGEQELTETARGILRDPNAVDDLIDLLHHHN